MIPILQIFYPLRLGNFLFENRALLEPSVDKGFDLNLAPVNSQLNFVFENPLIGIWCLRFCFQIAFL